MSLIQSSTGDKNRPHHLPKEAMWAWGQTNGSGTGVDQDMIITSVIGVTKTVATLPLLLTVATETVVHHLHNTMTANQRGDEMIEVYHRDHHLQISLMMVEDQTNMVTDPDPKI